MNRVGINNGIRIYDFLTSAKIFFQRLPVVYVVTHFGIILVENFEANIFNLPSEKNYYIKSQNFFIKIFINLDINFCNLFFVCEPIQSTAP